MLTSIVSSSPSTSIVSSPSVSASASSSTQKRRSVTFSTDSCSGSTSDYIKNDAANRISKKKTALLSAHSEETGMNMEDDSYYEQDDDNDDDYLEEDEDLFYRKEKWNPNSPMNPMYKSNETQRHYEDDDVSLNMEDIFPSITSYSATKTPTTRRTTTNQNQNQNNSDSFSDSISITDEITNSHNTSLLFGRNMKRIDLLHGTHNLNVDYDFDESDHDDDDDSISHIIHGDNDDTSNNNDDDDDNDWLLLPPNHSPQQPQHATEEASLPATNQNTTNKVQSSAVATSVSLQDYFKRPSPSNIVATTTITTTTTTARDVSSPVNSSTPHGWTTQPTTKNTTTTSSVTSSTMDNTSWNDESCSSCGNSQVLLG